MPGSPRKKERKDRERLDGDRTSNGTRTDLTRIDPEAELPEEPKKRGASPEFMREMTRRRVEAQARGEVKRGGKPRTQFTKAEKEAAALEKLMPRALKVLEEQLGDPDARIRQSAAIKIFEYVKGKPTQKVEANVDQTIHAIRYETVAFDTGLVLEGAYEEIDQEVPELTR